MGNITLESIIAEQNERIKTLRACKEYPYYKYDDLDGYQKWLAKTIRFLNINYPNDRFVLEFEKVAENSLTPSQQNALLALLEAIASLPTIIPMENKSKNKKAEPITIKNTINNTNTQSQSQEQLMAVNLFLEAIKDDLTGKQVKELKEILAESNSDKANARDGIITKLKSFGSDVAANIVANILTNPIIWSGL